MGNCFPIRIIKKKKYKLLSNEIPLLDGLSLIKDPNILIDMDISDVKKILSDWYPKYKMKFHYKYNIDDFYNKDYGNKIIKLLIENGKVIDIMIIN